MRKTLLGWLTATGLLVAGSALGQAPPGEAPRYVLPNTYIQVPFAVTSTREPSEVQVYISWDRGQNWSKYQPPIPSDARHFDFRPKQDGEFWFATRIIDRANPNSNAAPKAPQCRIVIDTQKPQLQMTAEVNTQGQVDLAWTIADPNLKPASLIVEYQDATGLGGPWQAVKFDPLKSVTPAGTLAGRMAFMPIVPSKQINLRAEVADAAGNKAFFAKAITLVAPKQQELAANRPAPDLAAKTWPSDNEIAARPAPATAPAQQFAAAGSPVASDATSPNGSQPQEVRNPYARNDQRNDQFAAHSRSNVSVDELRPPQLPPVDSSAMGSLPPPPSELPPSELPPSELTPSELSSGELPPGISGGNDLPGSSAGNSSGGDGNQTPGQFSSASPSANLPDYAPLPTPQVPIASQYESPRAPAVEAMPTPPEAVTPDYNSAGSYNSAGEAPPSYNPPPQPPSAYDQNNGQNNGQHYDQNYGSRENSMPNRAAESVAPPSGDRPRLTSSRRFSLEYDVESVGPEGVADVELWGTNDGGRTWLKWGSDPDRASPFDVEVSSEAQYGFRVVIVGRNGLTSNAPSPGDAADIWVAIDLTKPQARFTQAAYGAGENAGKLDIRWEATDSNLSSRPITILMGDRPEGPFATLAAGLPNSGQYLWEFDPRSPRSIYLRLEVRDDAGNVTVDQLRDPIQVEGLAPKGRILNLTPGSDTPRGAFRTPLFR